MGNILASRIAQSAADIMIDPNMVRITSAKWLGFINDSQIAIASLVPGSLTSTVVIPMVAGFIQSVPATAHCIVRPIQNMGADQSTPGTIVKSVDVDHFTQKNETWVSATSSAIIKLVMLDDDDPYRFYVYPPQPSSSPGSLRAVVGLIPTDIALIGDAITINDIYHPHILNYILFRAHDISTSPYSKQEAKAKWNLFVTGIGRKDMVDKIVSFNRNRIKEQGGIANDGQVR